ncbi:hypothetical protein F5878DRAFT_670693, partial [Lentinula raphanica]
AYDGEVVALSFAAGLATAFTERHPEVKHWQFFTDSAAAVEAIFDPTMKPGQSYCSNFHKKVTRTHLTQWRSHGPQATRESKVTNVRINWPNKARKERMKRSGRGREQTHLG